MRTVLSPAMERARIWNRALRKTAGYGPQGDFIVSPFGERMMIVASDGRDWLECGFEPPAWEHVSVSLKVRTPTWKEMEWVRDEFWRPEELVIQLSVPRADHISYHDYCLHMWRPIGIEIPMPPSLTVAPKKDVL